MTTNIQPGLWAWCTTGSGIQSKPVLSFSSFTLLKKIYPYARSFTSPGLPPPRYVEGFQGNEIPIDAEAVAQLCLHRLSLNEEVDD